MLIRVMSDLHLEFINYEYEVEPMKDDHKTLLVLAGDCGLLKHTKYAAWMKKTAQNFNLVFLVNGNHEFYSGKMHSEQDKFLARIDRPNVHVLQNSTMDIDGVLFVGGTLWTSFRSGNPLLMYDAELAMNDYNRIRVAKKGYRKLRAIDVLAEWQQTYRFILDTVEAEKDAYEKIVVVTHHAPSRMSIAERFRDDPMNDMYVNDFDYWIEEHGPDLWIHGHIHNSMDYTIGNTRVLCNPKGYPRTDNNGVRYNENVRFQPTLRLTI